MQVKIGSRDGKTALILGFTKDELKNLRHHPGELQVPGKSLLCLDVWGIHEVQSLYFVGAEDQDSLERKLISMVRAHEKEGRNREKTTKAARDAPKVPSDNEGAAGTGDRDVS